MAIVVARQIREGEFGAKIPENALKALRRSARVALATPLAGRGLPPGTRLLKAYATSARGPRRIVYLLAVEDGTLFLLFYRDKHDKLGANLAPQNPAFVRQLKKHLTLLKADLEAGEIEVLNLD